MSLKSVTSSLTADVATAGTFTIGYPAGLPGFATRGPWALGVAPKISFIDGGLNLSAPNDFTCSYGATVVTVTYNGATTLKAGWRFVFQFDAPGIDFDKFFRLPPLDRVLPMVGVRLSLGAPVVSAVANIAAAQAVAGAGNLTLTAGVLASTVPDVPRNVQMVSTSASDTSALKATVTGLDEYGAAMTELLSFNGTGVVAGLKAFAKITKVAISAAAVGNISMGTNTALGLPVYLPNSVLIFKELQDGALATSGTTVAGLSPNTKSTNATADVRGTYIPNATADGSKEFELVCILSDALHKGNPQA